MHLRELLRDDDAVSPVIGVILMVAVTVVLAAVIGAFVMGFGGNFGNPAPQASFAYDFETGGSGDCTLSHDDGDAGVLTITHETGERLQGDELSLHSDGTTAEWLADCSGATQVTAGDSLEVETGSAETVRITWSGEDGSATIGRWTGDDA